MVSQNAFFQNESQSEFIRRVYEETPAVIRHYFEQELEWLTEGLTGCRRAVEIGCGTGRARKAVPEPISYAGVDIGFHFVREAKSKFRAGDWICADACKLPFLNQSVECLFCIQNTIGNMEGIEQLVLLEMNRVLAPGGKAIVSAYSEDSYEIRTLWYDRLVECGIFGKVWIDSQNAAIVRSDTGWSSRCFSKEELSEMFAVAGFHVKIRKLDSFLYFCEAKNH